MQRRSLLDLKRESNVLHRRLDVGRRLVPRRQPSRDTRKYLTGLLEMRVRLGLKHFRIAHSLLDIRSEEPHAPGVVMVVLSGQRVDGGAHLMGGLGPVPVVVVIGADQEAVGRVELRENGRMLLCRRRGLPDLSERRRRRPDRREREHDCDGDREKSRT